MAHKQSTPEIAIAYHEAAHAVAHVVLGHKLYSVSRKASQPGKLGATHGCVLPKSLKSKTNWSGHQFTTEEIAAVKDDITILLIGDTAEAELHGEGRRFDANNPATSDEKQVVGRMTAVWPVFGTADEEVTDLAARARTIVEDYWPYIERVAEELLKRDVLSGRQVRVLRWPWPLRMLVRFAT